MDGYLEDDIVNFDLVNSILCDQRELLKRYKLSKYTFEKYDNRIKDNISKLKPDTRSKMKQQVKSMCDKEQCQHHLFDDEIVDFKFKMPSYQQRMMLFEKILYMVEKHY